MADDKQRPRIRFVISLVWVMCSAFNYASLLGAMTHRYPYFVHTKAAIGFSLFGPFALPASYFLNEGDNYRIVPLSKEERWEAYRRKWPTASREEFESGE